MRIRNCRVCAGWRRFRARCDEFGGGGRHRHGDVRGRNRGRFARPLLRVEQRRHRQGNDPRRLAERLSRRPRGRRRDELRVLAPGIRLPHGPVRLPRVPRHLREVVRLSRRGRQVDEKRKLLRQHGVQARWREDGGRHRLRPDGDNLSAIHIRRQHHVFALRIRQRWRKMVVLQQQRVR